MSKTERDKIKGKYGSEIKKYDKEIEKKIKAFRNKGVDFWRARTFVKTMLKHPWDKLKYEEQLKIFPGYAKNPSWWNKIFNRVPKRASDKNKLKQIDLTTDCDGMVFSDDDKPDKYYW